MTFAMSSLITHSDRYLEGWRLFLKSSKQQQCMQQFIESQLPDIVSSLGNGKPVIRVLSVGGGSGEIDLHILSKIHDCYPGVTINNDIIEPKLEQILRYKANVAKTPDLDYINFCWHHKTANEFELEVKEAKENKKYDFIHMIQMLFYVKDIAATLQFFRNCLAPDGKLFISLVSGNSGWSPLFRSHLPLSDHVHYITADDVTDLLSSVGVKYQCYDMECNMDIAECFVEGDQKGELLLDFLTTNYEFKKNAPPDLRDEIMALLRSPVCSFIKNGKIIFNNNLSVIVVENA